MDIKNCRLLVTPTTYGKYDSRLKSKLKDQVGEVIYSTTGKPLTSVEVAHLLPGMDGYIAGLDTINSQALETADRLRVISRYGVGVDSVDLQACKDKNIIVTNTPGANTVSVAELSLGMILALARQLPVAMEATRRGQWPRLDGLSLVGKTIAIIGLGAIGKQLVRRLSGFDCHIVAYDPIPDHKYAQENQVQLLSMDEALPQADFVSLHVPLLPETRGLVNEAFITRMKKGSFLVNTSRGELLDEEVVFRALIDEHLSGAALDVFTKEPPGSDNPLLSLPQVIPTPHMGAHTDGAVNAMGWMSLEDCLAVLRGEEPLYRVI